MTIEKSISQQIKDYAANLGFDACGFCRAENIGEEEYMGLKKWIDQSFHGEMAYMANNMDKRTDPTLLVEGARTIISLALNYYPRQMQSADVPQFAYYAYGKDYHDVMKRKLQQLFDYIKSLVPDMEGRFFCDTAPVLERYWAMKAGVGFIGKNSLLIIPKKGSFFFLGELIVNIVLDYDEPCTLSCGNCTRCINACPTKAIVKAGTIDARKCISYQTIENKGNIDESVIPDLNNRLYGCDICQLACPWNRYSKPHNITDFEPSNAFLNLNEDNLMDLSIEEYRTIFKGSAVKRAKLSGLKRNLTALKRMKE